MSQDEMTERERVAREMAVKEEAVPWDKMTELMQNAFLHNADLLLNPPPIPESVEVGKTAAEETKRAEALQAEADAEAFAAMEKAAEEKEKPKAKSRTAPKKGQYFCTKCQINHVEDSKKGHRHLKHKE